MRRGARRGWTRSWLFASLLLGVTPGCEDSIPAPDLPPAHDLASSQDLAGSIDLAIASTDLASAGDAARGVPCGDERCYNQADQYCHTTDWGSTGSCEMRLSPGTGYFACDGPEDCASGACCLLAGASVCGALGFCVAGQTVGEFMCHVDADCGVASRCCPKSAAGPFRACVDGLASGQACPIP